MYLTKEAGFTQMVPFSGYQVEKIMEKNKEGGKDYKSFREIMNQLVGITVYAEETFWDNKQKKYITIEDEAFHIIERWKFNKKGKKGEGFFKWGDVIYQSIVENGYIKNLDIKFYYSLEEPLARRLFRFLDKVMAETDDYEIDIFELAGHLGISYFKYISKIKERLDPAIEELKKRGWIRDGRYVKRKGFLRVRFLRKALSRIELDDENIQNEKKDKNGKRKKAEKAYENEVFDKLSSVGVTRRVAEQLIKEYPEEVITAQIEALAHRKADDPAAMLISSIQNNWNIPVRYQEKIKKEQGNREQKQQREKEEREKTERRKQIEKYISSISRDDLASITSEARELAREEGKAFLKGRDIPQYMVNAYVHMIVEKRLEL